jgi:hypothetical protein
MNANELVTKAIREGMEYVGGKEVLDYDKEHFDNVDRMASTLSARLIVLTEERLREILTMVYQRAILCAALYPPGCGENTAEIFKEDAKETASRIMREVKGGE